MKSFLPPPPPPPPQCTHCKQHAKDIEINGRSLCYDCAIVSIALSSSSSATLKKKRRRSEVEEGLVHKIEDFWERTLKFAETRPEIVRWMEHAGWGPKMFRAAIVVPALEEWILKNK